MHERGGLATKSKSSKRSCKRAKVYQDPPGAGNVSGVRLAGLSVNVDLSFISVVWRTLERRDARGNPRFLLEVLRVVRRQGHKEAMTNLFPRQQEGQPLYCSGLNC
jgi:hypothetical protein